MPLIILSVEFAPCEAREACQRREAFQVREASSLATRVARRRLWAQDFNNAKNFYRLQSAKWAEMRF